MICYFTSRPGDGSSVGDLCAPAGFCRRLPFWPLDCRRVESLELPGAPRGLRLLDSLQRPEQNW